MDAINLRELTATIIRGYVSNNHTATADLPALVRNVANAISALQDSPEPQTPSLAPHVPINKTVNPDYIISLEDGKKYKLLRRHLSKRGLTPEEYRAKWGLSANYPMVAPAYAASRSEMAKKLGLGRKAAPQPEPKIQRKKNSKKPAP